MEDYFFLGAYWNRRKLTLREYADMSKAYLQGLRDLHPAFKDLYEVGDKPNDEAPLADDLSNLDELVYHRSSNERSKYEHINSDSTLSWKSTGDAGFGMIFNTGKSYTAGGITLSISAGKYFPEIPNAVTINFPRRDHPEFAAKYPDFHSYGFLKRLLALTVKVWNPEAVFVTSKSFRDKVDFKDDAVYDENWQVGWLTYLENPEATAALPPEIAHEPLDASGVLITTTREIASATNPEHVATALLIRDTLHARGLLQRKVYEDPV